MDLMTHLPTVSSGYDSVCTILDCLSKYVYFILFVETISAEGLLQLFFCTIIARHGMPCRIILDRDPRFTSKLWSAFVSALRCEHAKSSFYHPETDG